MTKKIIFCSHAENKFKIFEKHGLRFTKTQIIGTIINAEEILMADHARKIAQKSFDSEYILRVIFEETNELITVITFYPAKRSRYEY